MQEPANAAGILGAQGSEQTGNKLTVMFPCGAGEGEYYRAELEVRRDIGALKVSELRHIVVRFAQAAKEKAGLDLQYDADRAFSLALYDEREPEPEDTTQQMHFIYEGGRLLMSEDRTMSSIKKELAWPDLEDLRFICSFDELTLKLMIIFEEGEEKEKGGGKGKGK